MVLIETIWLIISGFFFGIGSLVLYAGGLLFLSWLLFLMYDFLGTQLSKLFK